MKSQTDGWMGWVVNATPPAALPPQERQPIRILQVDCWTSGLVWTVAKNLFSAGIRSPDPPERSE
jgi:hypothetical protein